MRRFSNVSTYLYSPISKQSSRIDWNKQLLYDKVYPGKIFYEKDNVLIRSCTGSLFKKLTPKEIMMVLDDIQMGDSILLKDTVDSQFTRFINDVLVVDRIDDEGRIHGRFRNTQEYINLLPELDVMINLSKGNKQIKMIRAKEGRNLDR